jgi:predicted transcriptional regulator
MEQIEIDEKVSEGFIHARIIVEILGKPKDHVVNTLKEYIDRITKSKEIFLLKNTIAEAKEQDNMFSSFADIEILIKGVSNLIGFCFDYMPSSIEVIAPEKMIFNNGTVSSFINDLQAKLHTLDMSLKKANTENTFLKRNIDKLLRNIMNLVVGSKERSLKDISEITGIPQKDAEFLLDQLVKENVIKKSTSGYIKT